MWMDNLLTNTDNYNVVLFTNMETYDEVKKYECDSVHIIMKEFEEFHCAKYDWINNHKKNDTLNHKSRYNTDYRLNMVWNEKVTFVHDVYTRQIFNAEYYCWCDIGYFRNERFPLHLWPKQRKLSSIMKNRIYYCQVISQQKLNEMFRYYYSKDSIIKTELLPNQVSIAGGFFLTHKDNIEWWFEEYYKILDIYYANNWLVKDDQMIIFTAFINNIKNFSLIKSRIGDPWFAFRDFLLK